MIKIAFIIDKEFKSIVNLQQIKEHTILQYMPLVKHTRLSVMPIKEEEAKAIFELSK